jgi:hypothetical protein
MVRAGASAAVQAGIHASARRVAACGVCLENRGKRIGRESGRSPRPGRFHAFDEAAVLTNDTDLVEPIRIATQEAKLPVTLLTPVSKPATSLAGVSSHIRHIQPYLGPIFPFASTTESGNTQGGEACRMVMPVTVIRFRQRPCGRVAASIPQIHAMRPRLRRNFHMQCVILPSRPLKHADFFIPFSDQLTATQNHHRVCFSVQSFAGGKAAPLDPCRVFE